MIEVKFSKHAFAATGLTVEERLASAQKFAHEVNDNKNKVDTTDETANHIGYLELAIYIACHAAKFHDRTLEKAYKILQNEFANLGKLIISENLYRVREREKNAKRSA